MQPIIKQVWTPEDLARKGIRGIDDFSVEELALLRRKVEGWIRQQAPSPERTRRRP
jgi:hypothetical protein